jgi:DNA polymerase/3'-5' exonuclease PolX
MPVHNAEIAGLFEGLANLLEPGDANPFRLLAYRNAARTVRGYAEPMTGLIERGADPTRLANIGDELAANTATIVAAGRLPQLTEVASRDRVRLCRTPPAGRFVMAVVLEFMGHPAPPPSPGASMQS